VTISGFILKLAELREELVANLRDKDVKCEDNEQLDSLVPKVKDIASGGGKSDSIAMQSVSYADKYVTGEAVTI
jgi:hypothetical protein